MNVPKKLCSICVMAIKGKCDQRGDCEIMPYVEVISYLKYQHYPEDMISHLAETIMERRAIGIKNARLDFTAVIGVVRA